VGEWRGSILDFYFEPIEELRLSIREGNGGAAGFVGELVWGEGEPPPPATDPDAPYPPGADPGGMGWAGSVGVQRSSGFPYTVVRGAGCDAQVRVSVSAAELYDSWCALQTPIDNGELGWGCMIKTYGGSSDGVTCTVGDQSGDPIATYPMWRCELCGFLGPNVCACNEEGCGFNPEPTHTYDLTLIGDGNVLSGPDSSCGDCTVRLERVE
jgi:hypothetical protein